METKSNLIQTRISRRLEPINNIKILTTTPYEREYEIETLIDMSFNLKIDKLKVTKVSDILFRVAFTVLECNQDVIYVGYYMTHCDSYGYLILLEEDQLKLIGDLEIQKLNLLKVG